MTARAKAGDDPTRIGSAAARLRDAGRSLRAQSRTEVVGRLSEWLAHWRSDRSSWQAELASDLAAATGQHETTVRHGLGLALDAFDEGALLRCVHEELSPFDRAAGFDLTGVVLAGSIPMPGLLAVLWPLALQSAVLVKSAARDPVTAGFAARTLAEVDPLLGRCIEPVAFDRDADGCRTAFVEGVDCVVATGSDGAVAAWAGRAAGATPPRRFVGDGHRLSIAALGPEADLEREARALALDTALWDQQGCLSPVSVYTVGAGAGDRARALAGLLADALREAEARWPRGACPPQAAAWASHERALAEMRAAEGGGVTWLADEAGRWCVVAEVDAAPRPAPLYRFLRVHPLSDQAAAGDTLEDALRPLAPHLAGVALAGFGRETDRMAARLAALGASRLCAPGRLQTPPLDWHHDGRPLLLPLCRIADREVP